MRSENHKQLDGLLALLSPAAAQNLDPVQKEPLTYHRRGHWFEPSIAHHIGGSHNVFELIEYINASIDPDYARWLEMRQMSNHDLPKRYDN